MKKSAVVLGNFDGVHKAHAALIKNACKDAEENGLSTVAFMFDAHPKSLLGTFSGSIMSNDKKSEIIKRLGVQNVVYEPLTEVLLKTEPEDFAREYLSKKLNAKIVWVGYDYSFGRNKAGTPQLLCALGKKYGFSVFVMPKMMYGDIVISSTAVREALSQGNIKLVNELCTETYEICGIVEHGRGLGSKLGIPTVNVYFEKNMLIPAYGVYVSCTNVGGREYKSITNIGTNPTVSGLVAHAESYILDFDGDLYGKKITVKLYDFIRSEKKFNSIDELKNQIQLDINARKNITAI